MIDGGAFFGGKRITLLGLGLLGRGVGDAEYLAQCGAEVVVTDQKSAEELKASVERLKVHSGNITFHLGGHKLEDFTDCDMVIKAAGVPLDSPEIAAAREAGVPVYMSTALFAKYAAETGAVIVGVTGTRGKTTVSRMIYEALKLTGKEALLGGNVRGISTLAMLPQVSAETIAVLELDSWQLQGFGDLELSPHIAVFTNLMPDHLNYYGGDMQRYFADKTNIFAFQKEGDTLIIGNGLAERLQTAHTPSEPFCPQPIPASWSLQVPGEHNRENAALAAAALRALGLSDEQVRSGLEAFKGVEGRLQLVSDARGKKIYNDNNATTPEATIAALHALGENLTLICGGSEKALDLSGLVGEIKKRVAKLIVLTHDNYRGSQRLIAELHEADVAFEEAASLDDALRIAIASDPAIVLFSPAFASFGMFDNEYERNDEFLRIVGDLS